DISEKPQGIFRSDDKGQNWTFIMDSPQSRDLNASLLDNAVQSVTVTGSVNDFTATGWRSLGATHRFRLSLAGTGAYIKPDFSAVTSMDDVLAAIRDAIQKPNLFGANAVTVKWDALHSRLLIISNTLDSIRIKDPTGADSLFSAGLNVTFVKPGDI